MEAEPIEGRGQPLRFLPCEGSREAHEASGASSPLRTEGSVIPLAAIAGAAPLNQSSPRKAGSEGGLPFESLVDLHYRSLYRFALSLTRSESDASDLVQETFLAWAAKGHQLRDQTKVKSWLFTTLHRCFLLHQRHIVRFPHVEITAADEELELPSIEPKLADRLDTQWVLDLLAQVPPQCRAAVALFYLEDHSYLEIADILGIPLGTVKSRIGRGLAYLRALVLRASPDRRESTEGAL